MNIPPRFEISIILSFEIVSDFGFRASDFIVPLTNIAENLAKNARLFFYIVEQSDGSSRGGLRFPEVAIAPKLLIAEAQAVLRG